MKEYLKKYKLYIIIGVSILILSVGGTLAYYIWSSNTNAIVNTEVCTPTVTFAGGSTINGVDIVPVLTKEEGTIKDIEVKKNSTCNRDVTMNLYLELTTFPTELAESSFVYELYKNSETMAIASGNFANRKEGDTITLLSNQILNTNGEGAIYKENVITTSDNPSASTSKFFNTEVMREEIQSLTIAEDNTVPDTPGVVSKDISQNKDGTVMLWYTPKEVASSDGSTKTMYDMWIGGENGVLQTGTNASGMFAYLTNIEKLDLSKLDTSYITNMSWMFYQSSGLKTIDLSNFNTSNVTDMSYMFNGCSNLLNLDVSNFDTSKVTSMRGMFSGASSLQTLNIANFNLSNVTTISQMFQGCTNLINLILPNSSAPKLISMWYTFYNCTNLKGTIDLSNFKPNNYVDFEFAFYYCKNITEVKLNNFKFSSFRGAFYGCTLLEKIDFTGIGTSNITSMQYSFTDCSSLKSLDLTNFDVSTLATNKNSTGGLWQTFAGCSSLETLNITGWKITNKVTNLYGTFDKCSKLKKLDLSNWDTTGVTDLNYTFRRMTNIEEIDLRRADFSNVTSTNSVFYLTNNNVKIIVKDDIQKNWFNTNFSNLTNIVVTD